jgi:regulator of nonsense transcripts 2
MSSSTSPPANPWAESSGAGAGRGGGSSTGRGGGSGGGRKRGKGGGGGRGGGGSGGRGGGRGGAGAAPPASSNNSNPKASASTENVPSTSKRAKNNNKGGRGGGGGADSNKNDTNTSKSKQQRNKSNAKEQQQQQPPEAPKISAEERAKQEQVKREKEQALAQEKRVEQALKAEAARTKQRQKAQQQLEQDIQDAADSLEAVVESTMQHVKNRNTFRAEVLAKFRKEFETDKKKLKTDLKKCTAFVKKIKSGSAWSMRPSELQKDVSTLNLSRYVEEVAGSILETKPKLADIPVIVALCAAMHERYTDFMPNLVPGLWNVVQGKGVAVTPDTAKLRRIYMRLLTEFLLHGLVPETKQLVTCIGEATGGKDGSYAVQDANIVVAFGKAAGFEILGGMPQSVQASMALIRKEQERFEKYQENKMPGTDTTTEEESKMSNQATPNDDEPLLVSSALLEKATELVEKVQGVMGERGVTPEISEVFSTYCMGAYRTLATSLVQTHTKLQKLEKRCEQDRLLSGNLAEAREKGLADARKLKESLQKSVETLSDVLDQHVPVLEEDQDDAEEGGAGIEVWTKTGGDDENDFGPYDDEETRAFYCDIPDLLATTPAGLLGMTPVAIETQKAANLKKYGAEAEPEMEEGDTVEMAPASEEELEAKEQEMDADGEDDEGDKQEGGEENKDTPHYKLMVLLEQELPECNRREQLDEITEKFCTNHGSSKNARKRLQKVLFLVPRSRLDLLPHYSRMIATLDRVWLDIAAPLVTDLEQQFHGQAKFKKNQNIDSRMRTARYIGELTKFEVAPPIVALRCVKRCLEDFTGNNVDVACCLLESCGRFLYRKNITSARLTTLMDSMQRLSKVKVSLGVLLLPLFASRAVVLTLSNCIASTRISTSGHNP